MIIEILYWILLISTLFELLFYFITKSKMILKSKYHPHLAIYLIICVIAIFIIEQGHFLSHHFYESKDIGILCFAYKMALGISLTIFALLNQKT